MQNNIIKCDLKERVLDPGNNFGPNKFQVNEII